MPTDLQSRRTTNPESETGSECNRGTSAGAPPQAGLSAARLDGYTLTDLTVSYEPGVTCPLCNEQLSWHQLKRCELPRWLECESCELLINIETEEVWRRA